MSIRQSVKGLVAASLLFASVASAAPLYQTEGHVDLAGTVDSQLDMAVSATYGASHLDLTPAVNRIVQVANLSISTNNVEGAHLTATGSILSNGAHQIAFQTVSVADGADAPTDEAFSGFGWSGDVSEEAGAAHQDLFIMFTTTSADDPGAYTGSITLNVEDR